LKGTKYDRFWVESIQKKFNTVEKLQPIMEFLPTCTGIEAWLEWVTLFMMNE